MKKAQENPMFCNRDVLKIIEIFIVSFNKRQIIETLYKHVMEIVRNHEQNSYKNPKLFELYNNSADLAENMISVHTLLRRQNPI